MKEDFQRCVDFVLQPDIEGGNDDDPDDPGGRTSRGITQKEYDAYSALHGLVGGDVWQAPIGLVREIYYESYWLPWCDRLVAGVDLVFFDMSVNNGMHKAIQLMQRALRVDDDGHIGVITRAALAAADNAKLVHDLSERRRFFYRQCRGYRKYGAGWFNRVDLCEKAAQKMMVVPT